MAWDDVITHISIPLTVYIYHLYIYVMSIEINDKISHLWEKLTHVYTDKNRYLWQSIILNDKLNWRVKLSNLQTLI